MTYIHILLTYEVVKSTKGSYRAVFANMRVAVTNRVTN